MNTSPSVMYTSASTGQVQPIILNNTAFVTTSKIICLFFMTVRHIGLTMQFQVYQS